MRNLILLFDILHACLLSFHFKNIQAYYVIIKNNFFTQISIKKYNGLYLFCVVQFINF